MKRIFWTIAGVCFALYLFHGCFFYKSMTHLSKDDLEWIKAGKQNYEAIFESDRGTRSRLILMGSYEANSTNPMAFVFETSDEYQANAGYEFEINDKYRKGKALGIDFQVQFCYEAGDGISVFDMGILLNNLLDNAMEACEKLEQSQRYIRLALKRKDHFLLLEVENSFDGVIKWEQGSPVPASRKEKEPGAWMEHGIGLKNVKEIAERYLGVMDIKINGNIFRITVMLQEEG